jgi:hypothetical protein
VQPQPLRTSCSSIDGTRCQALEFAVRGASLVRMQRLLLASWIRPWPPCTGRPNGQAPPSDRSPPPIANHEDTNPRNARNPPSHPLLSPSNRAGSSM